MNAQVKQPLRLSDVNIVAKSCKKYLNLHCVYCQKYRPHYTYNDYLLWEGRWELIEGMPYALRPAPNRKHQRVASELNALFVVALRQCKQCQVYEPVDWKITEETVVQPDLSVVCKPFNNNNFLDFPPVLVAEIISPSTAQKDRREKFELYQQEQVRYYLIIDPAFNKVEIFEHINGNYQPVSVNPQDFTFTLEDCSATINFNGLFDE